MTTVLVMVAVITMDAGDANDANDDEIWRGCSSTLPNGSTSVSASCQPPPLPRSNFCSSGDDDELTGHPGDQLEGSEHPEGPQGGEVDFCRPVFRFWK